MPRMYFAHPINVYDTPLEAFLLERIRRTFPSWEIENPNRPHHQRGYQERLAKTGRGMDYYYEDVLPLCNGCIALPFIDGAWGTGVFGESKHLARLGAVTFRISHRGVIRPMIFRRQNVLTVDETRSRIRTPSGLRIPYEGFPAIELFD